MKPRGAALVLSWALTACQALLSFGADATDGAPSDAATSDAAVDAISDAPSATEAADGLVDAALPCGDPHVLLCADFENGRDLSAYGFDASSGSPGYTLEPSPQGGTRLRVDQGIAVNQRFDITLGPDTSSLTFAGDLAAKNANEAGALDGNYVSIARFTAGAFAYELIFDPTHEHQFLFAVNEYTPGLQGLSSLVLVSPVPVDGSPVHVDMTFVNGDAGATLSVRSPLKATYEKLQLPSVQKIDGFTVGQPQGIDVYFYYDNLLIRAD